MFVAAVTLAPAIFGIFFIPNEDGYFLLAIFSGICLFYLWPIAQVLGFVALYVQIRKLRKHGSPGSLSVRGLFLQAIVFFLVGISFYFRFRIPAELFDPDPDRPDWNTPLARFVIFWENW